MLRPTGEFMIIRNLISFVFVIRKKIKKGKRFSGYFFNDAIGDWLGDHCFLESRGRDVPNNGFL